MSEVKPVETLDEGGGRIESGSADSSAPWFAIGAIALVIGTLAAYAPSLRGTFLWDDALHLTRNPQLLDATGLQNIWFSPGSTPQYYPLSYTSFWIERRLWGDNSAGYKIVNILLHAAGAVLGWAILRRLGFAGAGVVAAVFALHPMHVESVAWIKERTNVLSGALYLSAALVYLRYCGLTPAPPLEPDEKPSMFSLPRERDHLYGLAVTFFVLALLAKTVACTFPLAMLLLIYWKRGRVSLDDLKPLVPFFALALVAGAVTVYFEQVNLIGGISREWDYAPTLLGETGHRIAVAGRAIWFYVGKLLFPYPLSFVYQKWTIDPTAPLQYIPAAAAGAALAALWILRRRIGRGPFVAAAFFAVTIFPTLGFFDVASMRYSFVADHYIYLASLGIFAGVVGVVATLIGRIESARRLDLGSARYVAAGVGIAALAALTSLHAPAFTSESKLCKETLTRNPAAANMATRYGAYLFSVGQTDAAEGWFRRVLTRLKPDSVEARIGMASIALRNDKSAEAIELLRAAVAQPEDSPDAKFELARTLESTGDLDGAARWFDAVANEDPRKAFGLSVLIQQARMREGAIHLRTGDLAKAMAEYQAVLAVNPMFVPAQTGLGETLGRAGRIPEGTAAFAQAMQLAPNDYDVLLSLARFLVDVEQMEQARGTLVKATGINRRRLEAYLGIGEIELKLGRVKEAVEVYEYAANAIAPRSRAAQEGLAKARAALAATTQPTTQPKTGPATQSTIQRT